METDFLKIILKDECRAILVDILVLLEIGAFMEIVNKHDLK